MQIQGNLVMKRLKSIDLLSADEVSLQHFIALSGYVKLFFEHTYYIRTKPEV